ncbi:MAG: hypothetical protein AAFS10_13300, partial [Myxococcota bacterium]
MNSTLPIAALQHPCGPDPLHNLELSCDLIVQAAQQGAALIVLQELHRSIYFCQTEEVDCFEVNVVGSIVHEKKVEMIQPWIEATSRRHEDIAGVADSHLDGS